jgi:hypothetical protein
MGEVSSAIGGDLLHGSPRYHKGLKYQEARQAVRYREPNTLLS